MRKAGKARGDIVEEVTKKDGSCPSLRAVDGLLAKSRAEPEWDGTDSRAGGRPRELSKKERSELRKLVFSERGKAVVTAPFCKKRLPFLRRVCDETIRRELQRAGLAWLNRRMKSAVPKPYKVARQRYCKWLLKQRAAFLNRFAYTDGTTFYIARTEDENSDKQRAGLGRRVWRMANGKDGLWDENVGPSCYAKGQGRPVKIWGIFADGRLEYWVLPVDGARTTNMNGERYNHLVKTKYAKWRRSCFGARGRAHLVKDYEKCLWQTRNMEAEKEAGFDVVERHPKCSPDLNAIEGWWRRLKDRLLEQAPVEIETRAEFVTRLRRTVTWLNQNARAEGRKLCTNQKERARQVLLLRGARCKW